MLTPDAPDSTASPTTTESITPAAGGYERTDINMRGVVVFFGLVGISLAGVQLGVWELLQMFRADVLSHKASQSPRASGSVAPPGPRLQDQPLIEYSRFVDTQDARLNSYGWVDQRQGVVHIPITDAIDILATRGLPIITEPGALLEKKNGASKNLKRQ
ncbi:MAG: hypothetical protein JWN70_5220 [Planctomycetaceae bacterium]|nr:hypothetical protein [Planctomycetaceae bacterium]